MEKKDDEIGQLDLFSTEESKSIKKEPRAKNIPANEKKAKNTESSASIFGWHFQIVTGIIFSLLHIEELESVEIEGATEDIELHFHENKSEYIQVKSIQKNPIDSKDNSKATDAMNTLINTSNLTKGTYSKLVYVVNFRNPLNLSESILAASWMPKENRAYIRPYTALPEEAQKFIHSRVSAAQKQLDKKYLSSIDNFDYGRLFIATILFGSDERDQERFSALEGALEDFFLKLKLGISPSKINRVKNMLENYYIVNAGSNEYSEWHQIITKERLIWRIIFEIIDEVPAEFLDSAPMEIQTELQIYGDDFFAKQAGKIEIVNQILAGLKQYYPDKEPSKSVCNDFIDSHWKTYRDLFPIADENQSLREYGTKMIMLRAIRNKRTINNIKRKVNLK